MFSKKRRTKGAIAAMFALWLGVSIASRASADTAFEGEKTTDKLKFSGDMRVRHEAFYVKSNAASGGQNSGQDRNRERLRLRFGVTASLQDFTAGFRLASGVGEQVSTNQTYTNDSNQKALWIDQAYISWKAHEYVKLTGGKMANPLWRTYASDLVFDDDLSPEGYAQQFEMPLGDRFGIFANFLQSPLNEAGTTADAWMFSHQIGTKFKIDEDSKLTLAAALHAFTNEKAANFIANGAVQQYGNTRVSNTSGQLATNMRLFHITSEATTHLGALPLALDVDFVHNMNDTAPDHQSSGYQAGAIVGKAKNAKTWEVAYFYKYLENNATFADFADSDFGYTGGANNTGTAGGGGTNRKGHIFWLAYAPRDYVTIKAKYFITNVLNPYLNPWGRPVTTPVFDSINRFQLDLVVKF